LLLPISLDTVSADGAAVRVGVTAAEGAKLSAVLDEEAADPTKVRVTGKGLLTLASNRMIVLVVLKLVRLLGG